MNISADLAARGQVTGSAAEIYDRVFVPALFGQFATVMVQRAGLKPGLKVLDLACGTGAVARAIHQAVGRSGRVTGIDINPGMLDVARRSAAEIEWVQGAAESLPFDPGTFDAVLCQFALMFFADRGAAIAEARRVLRPGGTITFSTWASLADTPGYRDLVPLVGKVAGSAAAEALSAPFNLGDETHLAGILGSAGFVDVQVERVTGTARFPSIEDWVRTEVGGWTLSEMIDAAGIDRLVAEAHSDLAEYAGPDGRVAFPAPALFATGRRA